MKNNSVDHQYSGSEQEYAMNARYVYRVCPRILHHLYTVAIRAFYVADHRVFPAFFNRDFPLYLVRGIHLCELKE